MLFLILLIIVALDLVTSESTNVTAGGKIAAVQSRKTLELLFIWSDNLSGPLIPAGFRIGVQHVKDILPEHDIVFHIRKTSCNPKLGMKTAVTLWQSQTRLDGIIGSGCSVVCQPVGLLAAAWNIPQVAYYCASSPLTDKKVYPTFTRVLGTYDIYSDAVLAFMETFKWTKLSIVTNTAALFTNSAETAKRAAESQGITVHYVTVKSPVQDGKIDQVKLNIMRKAIHDIKLRSRVTLMLMYHSHIRIFLILAAELGLTNGEYVFMGFDATYAGTAGIPSYFKPHLNDAVVYHGVVAITNDDPSGEKWNEFITDLKTDFRSKNMSNEKIQNTLEKDKVAAGLTHDAVLLWAHGVKKTIEQGYAPNDGIRVTNNIINSTSQGITGNIVIDRNGDRLRDFKVTIWQNGKRVKLMRWDAAQRKLENVYKPDDPDDWSGILWSGNATKPPTGVPHCGWDRELCEETRQSYIHIYIILLVILLLLVMGTGLLFRQYRKKKALAAISNYVLDKTSWEKIENETNSRKSLLSMMSNQEGMSSHVVKIGQDMALLKVLGTNPIPSAVLQDDLMKISLIKHENINPFLGVCIDPQSPAILMLYASRGSLYNVIHLEPNKLSMDVKQSLVLDVALGMTYLHNSSIETHGHLSSQKCVVDARWICKVTDYGMNRSIQLSKGRTSEQSIPANRLLWTAPELLRGQIDLHGTQAGDVYAFGVIVQEVTLQDEPFALSMTDFDPEEIIARIRNGDRFMKPQVPDTFENMKGLVDDMCAWNPSERPSLKKIVRRLRTDEGGESYNLVDRMISRLEVHTQNLETNVEARSHELQEEKQKTEILLQDLLPKSVIEDFKLGKPLEPQSFDNVTIFFSDIVSFTRISAAGTPMDVVRMLNLMYILFDDISAKFDVYKIATIGDAYFVASGVPVRNGNLHAREIANMALALLEASADFAIPHVPSETLKLRIGIHTGPCVAGVVGMKTPRYLLFGESVDTASRMESSGEAMRIHISETTASLLMEYEELELVTRQEDHPIKGLENLNTLWLEQRFIR